MMVLDPLTKTLTRLVLPAALGDSGQLTAVRHVAEANTRDTELGEGTTGATVDRVTAAYTHR